MPLRHDLYKIRSYYKYFFDNNKYLVFSGIENLVNKISNKNINLFYKLVFEVFNLDDIDNLKKEEKEIEEEITQLKEKYEDEMLDVSDKDYSDDLHKLERKIEVDEEIERDIREEEKDKDELKIDKELVKEDNPKDKKLVEANIERVKEDLEEVDKDLMEQEQEREKLRD